MECLCPLNNLRVIPHPDRFLEPCTKHRLATPACCVECVEAHGQFVGGPHKLERELSRFQSQEYQERLLRSLANAEAVLVHNPLIAAVLEPYGAHVRVVPIGVDSRTFGEVPSLESKQETTDGTTRILFAGRTNDPVKGFQVLRAAGRQLWQERRDFCILATGVPSGPDQPFIRWQGWQSHGNMVALLASADLLAAPAVASEPFGLSVVEAMAAARPVVASRVGGQQFTVVDGLTGLLCDPDNPSSLAEKLSMLLDSPELRIRLGNAARQRFVSEYAWDVVVERHYRPLFELKLQACSGRENRGDLFRVTT
jgi:glycosyltransferase involved in cell wall biosynthesis